jgi:20S proteasome alpha/beta subunit
MRSQKRSKRKEIMTLVLALKCRFLAGDSVLVASDSRATTSFGIQYEVKKLYPIALDSKPVAIASGAGDISLVKWGFETAEDVLVSYAQQENPLKYITFRKAVRKIESRLAKRFSELRALGVDPSFQMILCSLDESAKASIYQFDDRGLAEPRHDNPGYAIIGQGFITGGILLLRLLGYAMDLDLGILTTFILDSVSEVDSTVGPFVGESYLLRKADLESEKKGLYLGPLRPEGLLEFKKRSAKRNELIKKLWRICDRPNGETALEEALNSLSEERFQKNKVPQANPD